MGTISEWEQTTLKLQAQMEAERALHAERLAELDQALYALDFLLREYHAKAGQNNAHSTELPVTPEEVIGKTQREVMELIASKNGGIFDAKKGITIMKELELFGNPINAYAVVYRVLNRPGSKFEKVSPGVYKLRIKGPVIAPLFSKTTEGGLVEKVKEMRQSNPSTTRTQVASALVAEGFDFGEKNPAFAVSAAWMNLERRRKHGLW